jgi:hypothetical protein
MKTVTRLRKRKARLKNNRSLTKTRRKIPKKMPKLVIRNRNKRKRIRLNQKDKQRQKQNQRNRQRKPRKGLENRRRLNPQMNRMQALSLLITNQRQKRGQRSRAIPRCETTVQLNDAKPLFVNM